MPCFRLAAVLAVLLTLAAASTGAGDAATPPPRAETVAAFEQLKLVPPRHYCALDPSFPEEANLLELARIGQNFVGSELLVLWRDCKARPPTGRLDDYSKPSIAIAARIEDGHIVHLRMTRLAFLQRMDRDLAPYRDSVTNAQEAATYLGIEARDEDAVYLGALTTERAHGKEFQLATVLAATLVKGMALEITVSEDFDGDRALTDLTGKAQEIVHRLLDDNSGP